ncbi:alkaline phosphatase D family protein [uncultured Ramlibacter sp.]|uniref:alkaline phosphatase D family protein n=1 Tax=uncultured Ramlibacter sp. TaxID=260755 RepID=UPI002616B679|nr:alkaline phosphatase D family protein [uncultured Ramlibacter sp.]
MQRRGVLALGAAAALPLAHAAAGPLRRIGFVSCIHQERPQALVDFLAEQAFDLFLFGGDNVYAPRPYGRDKLRAAYDKAAAAPGYTRLRRKQPHMAVWDDNDYDSADGGASFAFRQEAREEFLAFWQVQSQDPRRSQEGLYHAQTFGPPGQRVQVIVLDTRSFRSRILRDTVRLPGDGGYTPDPDPAKTMLGAAQWQWLEAQLRQPAEVRLLVSSIQVLAEGHRWERWGNLPAERERLLALVGGTGAQGVVLLSGDRHFGALYRREAGLPYGLTELTSSGVTHSWDSPTDAQGNRVGAPYTGFNYATVDIDWAGRSLRLAVRDAQGTERLGQAIAFNDLKA